ncbi:MAG: L-aspartate oxidase [Bacteroidales bacterium]|nr:L-aspartate oxidase [Bacteroidales bacterium]
MVKNTDFLVVGSGIAGLSFALKAAEKGRVCLASKVSIDETNTKYAQGGIASVMYEPDSFEKHIKDTLIAGRGFSDEDVVRMVVSESPDRINELVSMGVVFDRNSDGKYDLAREGGHTEHRILHHKDNTGEIIQETLSDKVRNHPNIDIYEHHFAVDLITQHHFGEEVNRRREDIRCYGAYVLDTESNKVFTVLSKITVLATGGIGNLYQTTTNPVIATGDGIAMVYRAKGIIENMEFIQFHPTSLYAPGERPSFLITEALRGFGAVLKNNDGEQFMDRYDERGSLAPRDVVARAIDTEMKTRGDDYVLLDCTHLNKNELLEHFPNIARKCSSMDIDITKDPIPVVPAAHYLCGGVKVDTYGESTIHNLYTVGEASSTGLHGANRLASNSLMEAVVYAHRAALSSSERINDIEFQPSVPEWNTKGTSHPEEMVLVTQNYKEVQMILSNYVGIVRSDLRLARALRRLEIIYRETEELYKKSFLSRRLCELRNLINVGYLVIKMASERHESLGLHYTIDYPGKDELPGKEGVEF